jgi:hypothetical protein
MSREYIDFIELPQVVWHLAPCGDARVTAQPGITGRGPSFLMKRSVVEKGARAGQLIAE